MTTMRRLVLEDHGRPLAAVRAEVPRPAGTEVLVRVRRCGICHTDLHLRHGYYELGGERRWRFADRGLVPPITLGHEIFGEIVATGPDGEGAGRRGVVYPWIGCGSCTACAGGSEDLCPTPRFLGLRRPGGYGEYVLVPHARYVLDAGTMDPSQAASLACAGLTAYSALKKVAEADGWLGIVGAGGIGLTAIALARSLGRERVVAYELDERRRAAALAAGAVHAVDPRDATAVAAVTTALGEPAAAMIDFVGRPETFTLGTEGLRRGGRYVLVGLFGGETTLVLPMLALRAISIAGSAVGSFAEMQELLALARAGRLPPLPVTLRPLEDANAALDDLENGRVVRRIVLAPELPA